MTIQVSTGFTLSLIGDGTSTEVTLDIRPYMPYLIPEGTSIVFGSITDSYGNSMGSGSIHGMNLTLSFISPIPVSGTNARILLLLNGV